MSGENVADKYWLNNKQIVGSFGMFILLGIGYGEFRGMQANDKVQSLEIKLIKENATEEEEEMKAAIYDLEKDLHNEIEDGDSEVKAKMQRMVNPLREQMAEVIEWMNRQKGKEE